LIGIDPPFGEVAGDTIAGDLIEIVLDRVSFFFGFGYDQVFARETLKPSSIFFFISTQTQKPHCPMHRGVGNIMPLFI